MKIKILLFLLNISVALFIALNVSGFILYLYSMTLLMHVFAVLALHLFIVTIIGFKEDTEILNLKEFWSIKSRLDDLARIICMIIVGFYSTGILQNIIFSTVLIFGIVCCISAFKSYIILKKSNTV